LIREKEITTGSVWEKNEFLLKTMREIMSLSVGDEVDYCPVGSFWVPARVQDILLPGSSTSPSSTSPSSSPSNDTSSGHSKFQSTIGTISSSQTTLLLRFSCGDIDVTHAVDIHIPSDAKKIAPVCE